MELILVVGIIAAFFVGHSTGNKAGAESALTLQHEKIHAGMNPDSVFCRMYGVPGLYLADASPNLAGLPLVVISSANFLRMLARQKDPDATPEEVEQMKGQLADKYLLATGMSPDTLAALKRSNLSTLPAREDDLGLPG